MHGGIFFGGLLNPILTCCTFIAVLYTIALQRKELDLSREELKATRQEVKRSGDIMEQQANTLKQQTFENTFFQMMNLHDSIISSLSHEAYNIKYEGRDVFGTFYNALTRAYSNVELNKNKLSDDAILHTAYSNYWTLAESKLAHYYRYLFNIVRFVDRSDFSNGPYMNLVRAQISNDEALLLFYNGLSKQGENFKMYIEKYALLNNMPRDKALNPTHLKFYSSNAYGENELT